MPNFAELSRVLLGDQELSDTAAAELLELISSPALLELVARFAARPDAIAPVDWVRDELWSTPTYRPTCELVITAWMFGSLPGADGTDLRWARRWFDGKFWKYARAHPPGLSGGYFGHWSYPPEE